jgi:hypothetical protein
VSDGYHLWSEKYDRELEDVFAYDDCVACVITACCARYNVCLFGQVVDYFPFALISPEASSYDCTGHCFTNLIIRRVLFKTV